MLWIQARFLEGDTTHLEISKARAQQEGVWVFTDGSVQADLGGAAAIIIDAHGPLDGISLRFPLGPLQSSTDAKLASICGAISWRARGTGIGLPLLSTHRWLLKYFKP